MIDLLKESGINPEGEFSRARSSFSLEENYILAKLQRAIRESTKLFDEFRINEVPHIIEDVLLSLSRDYIKLVRDKVSLGSADEKRAVVCTIYKVFMDSLSMFSTIAPFISEAMYQNIKDVLGLEEESVHLRSWPKVDAELEDDSLIDQMDIAKGIVQAALSAREKARISLRWPVSDLQVVSGDEQVLLAVQRLENIIKSQVNAKRVEASKSLPNVRTSIKANAGALGKDFGSKSPSIIARLSQVSAQDIVDSFDRSGEFALKVDGEEVRLKREHVIIERTVPESYIEASFKGGYVYLNTARSAELDAEGFAREIMRRVQSLRKEAGLERGDSIDLHIQVSDRLLNLMDGWQDAVAEKCQARSIKMCASAPEFDYSHSAQEKVKGETITVSLSKCE
ncbi:hypothetical protein D6825_00130 [Candidatus Woesearchaeota archaeon]|nr:MAG: hypothetical protein D6825_00130 [Candidatus Woesearchaeota archaeon]